MKDKTSKLLEKIELYLRHHIGKELISQIKAQITMKRVYKFDYISKTNLTKNIVCSLKDIIINVKKQATAQGNLFAIHISNKSLMSRIC